jgi:hypothetical protein
VGKMVGRNFFIISMIKISYLMCVFGRETGIRTLGTLAGTTDFESVPFDHSGTSPHMKFAFK